MSADLRPRGRKVAWGLRRYVLVLIACILALAAAPLLLPGAAPSYEAHALVVARQLAVKPVILPQLAGALFDDGAVAAVVAKDPAVGGDGTGLIPDRLSIIAAENSRVIVVEARDANPAVAVRLADLAANAFVDELNKAGAGVGAFELQSQAITPTEPLDVLPTRTLMALGALAGCALGLGLVALLVTLRRPVITAQDVEQVAGVPLLGTVQLPWMAHGGYAGPLGVRGIATVTRWLATVPPGRLLLTSHPSAAAVRQRLFVMVGVALWTVRNVRFAGPDRLVDAIEQHRVDHRGAGRTVHGRPEPDDDLVLVDGGSALEIVDPGATNVSVVAVAPLGVPQRRLRALAADYADGGLVGVVLADVRLGRGAARRARAAASVSPPAPGEREAKVPEPEPERA